ncbi:MAG: FixH family protein [Reichenbachiella sp.]
MNKYLLIIALLAMVSFMSCEEENEEKIEEVKRIELATISNDDYTVIISGEQTLVVGYNRLHASVTDGNGVPVDSESFMVMPMMTMMMDDAMEMEGEMSMMMHSCPVEYPNGMGLEAGEIDFVSVFVMPSTDMGSWTLDLMMMIDNEKVELSTGIDVVAIDDAIVKSFVGSDESKYFVAMVPNEAPAVGSNDFELAVYQKKSMMEWPAVGNLSIEIDPEMPTMGHGSNGNTDPVFTNNGHYMGTVNFTMTGYWMINVDVLDGETLLGETSFDIRF